MGVWPISTSHAALKYPRRHCNNGRLDHICSGILENSERKQRGQFDVCFIQQLTTEPIMDTLDPDTTPEIPSLTIYHRAKGTSL